MAVDHKSIKVILRLLRIIFENKIKCVVAQLGELTREKQKESLVETRMNKKNQQQQLG